MPDIVVQKITGQACRKGYTRGADPTLNFADILGKEACDAKLPKHIIIDGRDDKTIGSAHYEDDVDDDEITIPAKVNFAGQA